MFAILILSWTLPAFAQITDCWSSGSTYVTSLPACSKFASSHSKCFAIGPATVDTPAFKDCICAQKFFNLIVDCESETRVCLESTEEDGAAQQAISNWHAECDTWIDYTVTTPILSAPTVTLAPLAECNAIKTVCKSYGDVTQSCKQSFGFYTNLAAHPKLESCLCKPKLLAMESRCIVDGDTTCKGIPGPAVTNLDLWRECPKTARPTPAQVEARATAAPKYHEKRTWQA
ncbi:hypothetical protein CLAIMM_03712 [Cladophialophora immunda]|nr:hypothetical protein CLAIMM_03712 [Cladophialophora immunda]